jgi:hypothetical protein
MTSNGKLAGALFAVAALLSGCGGSGGSDVVEAGPSQAVGDERAEPLRDVDAENDVAGVSGPDVDGIDDVDDVDDDRLDEAIRALLATELFFLENDARVFEQRNRDYNRDYRDAMSSCLAAAGVDDATQQDLLRTDHSTLEMVDGNPLSREYVERYGFEITRSPQSEMPASVIVDDDVAPRDGGRPPESDHETNRIFSECEDAALGQISENYQAVQSAELLQRLNDDAAAAMEPTYQAKGREWRACMSDQGYPVADVDELTASLDLENRSERDAWRVEREAALTSHDCHGGEQGLRAVLQERVDIVTALVRSLSPAEQAELAELLATS